MRRNRLHDHGVVFHLVFRPDDMQGAQRRHLPGKLDGASSLELPTRLLEARVGIEPAYTALQAAA